MQKLHNKTILIMAGGTGGHIFPGLAIAKELSAHAIDIQWLGSKHGMENILVPKYHIKLHNVSTVGLRDKNGLTLIKAPFFLLLALFQTFKIFIRIKPDIVLGMGGFASGLGGVVAWILRIPLVIHEQNAIAGITNKLLSKLTTQTFQAFDGAFDQAITSGNPVLCTPKQNKRNNKKLNLLVVGGSLGSKPINNVVSQFKLDINIWHQTGKQHLDDVRCQYNNKKAKIIPFIDDMAQAYAWADVVLCRAGAMSVSELMLSAKPSILIPLPHAIDNHQFYNAKILADNNATILIEQKDFNVHTLTKVLQNLNQESLEKMSNNALKLAKPNAAKEISHYLLNI